MRDRCGANSYPPFSSNFYLFADVLLNFFWNVMKVIDEDDELAVGDFFKDLSETIR
jgi:hypothetical protein